MTKEEKLECIKKIDTQIDGIESYVREMKKSESQYSNGRQKLITIEGDLRTLRMHLDTYERVLNRQRD